MASATIAPTTQAETLLDKYGVAEQLGCHHETVSLWARKKQLKSARIGGRYRFRQAWVDEFIAANETGPAEPRPARNPRYATTSK